jgi:hypothetical protein
VKHVNDVMLNAKRPLDVVLVSYGYLRIISKFSVLTWHKLLLCSSGGQRSEMVFTRLKAWATFLLEAPERIFLRLFQI